MFKTVASILCLTFGTAFACSGGTYTLHGQFVEPDTYQVYSHDGYIYNPKSPGPGIWVGSYTVSGLKSHLQTQISNHALVFIGSIDSIIQKDNGHQDTLIPGFMPDFELAHRYSYLGAPGFYARIRVDTVFKGSLKEKVFWFRGYSNFSSCDVNLERIRFGKFLNYSDNLDSMPDLKVSLYEDFCGNCPRATTFDGRYFRSPDFPTVPLDIRELFPTYPVSIQAARPEVRIPLRAPGKAYRPDGRVVPEGAKPGKNPAPILRQAR